MFCSEGKVQSKQMDVNFKPYEGQRDKCNRGHFPSSFSFFPLCNQSSIAELDGQNISALLLLLPSLWLLVTSDQTFRVTDTEGKSLILLYLSLTVSLLVSPVYVKKKK